MPLTALSVRQARPKSKAYKLFDGRGLFLLVMKKGSKLWRYRFRYDGKEKQLSLGQYPDVSLAKARELRADASLELIAGVNPSETRKARRKAAVSEESTFEAVGREWLVGMRPNWAESHYSKVERRLEREIFPVLGGMPIGEIGPRDLLAPLKRISDNGKRETARRTKQIYRSARRA